VASLAYSFSLITIKRNCQNQIKQISSTRNKELTKNTTTSNTKYFWLSCFEKKSLSLYLIAVKAVFLTAYCFHCKGLIFESINFVSMKCCGFSKSNNEKIHIWPIYGNLLIYNINF